MNLKQHITKSGTNLLSHNFPQWVQKPAIPEEELLTHILYLFYSTKMTACT